MGGTSGPQRPDPARLGHGSAWGLHGAAKGGGDKSNQSSQPGTSGLPRREERPRGTGDRCAQGPWAS